MVGDDFPEGLHERTESLLAERRNCGVPVGALAEERMRSLLHGVCAEVAVQAGSFTCSTQKREKSLRERSEHQQAVAASGVSDVSAGQAHPEAGVFLVAEGLLDVPGALRR